MTTPEEFQAYLEEGLMQWDSLVPPGSKLLVMGLINASFVYQTMWNLTHPLGVKYWQWYNYLTCLGLNPCQGWLTTNATLREEAAIRASQLSSTAQQVVQTYQQNSLLKNLEIDYTPFPLSQAVSYADAHGLPITEMIGPVDGLHPTPIAHTIMAGIVWEFLETNHPDWLGEVNPFNNQIQELFGEQGGY